MEATVQRARARANAARRARLELLPVKRAPLLSDVYPEGSSLVVKGMHGLGDCLHQRAIVKYLATRFDLWLETSWPLVYWDVPGVKLLARGTNLRTQKKNAAREEKHFSRHAPPVWVPEVRVEYPPQFVRHFGSVLAAMCARTGVPFQSDFRLPVKPEWLAKADLVLRGVDKPVMLFRPLVERKEWGGGRTRNPNPAQYEKLFGAISGRFYVVSVADIEHDAEWMVGNRLPADRKFHRGELDSETLFGIAARASLIFGSPGFQTVLGQAIGTPTITVFGGYEDKTSFSVGAAYTKWLPIEPETPCACWSHDHDCPKDIDLECAVENCREFADAVISTRTEARRAALPA